MNIKTCIICNEEFTSNGGNIKCCSKKCSKQNLKNCQSASYIVNELIKNCLFCGLKIKCNKNTKKYCSKQCSDKDRKQNNSPSKVSLCIECGCNFETKPSKTLCSKECKRIHKNNTRKNTYVYKMKIKNCLVCNLEFNGKADDKFCCKKCRNEFNFEHNKLFQKEHYKKNIDSIKEYRKTNAERIKLQRKGYRSSDEFKTQRAIYLDVYFKQLNANKKCLSCDCPIPPKHANFCDNCRKEGYGTLCVFNFNNNAIYCASHIEYAFLEYFTKINEVESICRADRDENIIKLSFVLDEKPHNYLPDFWICANNNIYLCEAKDKKYINDYYHNSKKPKKEALISFCDENNIIPIWYEV